MSKKFLHVGCVTHDKDFPGLNYNKVLDCYCSDPTANEHNIEWLYFPETSLLAKTAIATTTHIAYMVDDLEAAVAGKEMVLEPIEVGPGFKIAFFWEDGALVENCQAS